MHGAILALSFAVSSALAAVYQNTENIVGAGFYNSFNFEAIPDPTSGRVRVATALLISLRTHFILPRNYVDQATATSANLTFASGDKFVLRADDTTVLDPSGAGRNSVRLQSKNAYSTHVAVCVDLSSAETYAHFLLISDSISPICRRGVGKKTIPQLQLLLFGLLI